MQAGRGAVGIAIVVMLALAGCSGPKEPHLMNLKSNKRGPDEFSILPSKPMEMPKDLAALPPPTPGGSNRTDPTPDADAVAALGGRPAALAGKGVPAADSALIAQVTRYGVSPTIRADLDKEDLEWRRRHPGRVFERAFGVSSYLRAYAPMSLDQYAELERWRRAGVRTVSAPPADNTGR